ncbi:MAG: dipeptide epimerase [Crenarchaeota archaeon]|nr:dipeptide epimerase [Thermoproteota archaeon]
MSYPISEIRVKKACVKLRRTFRTALGEREVENIVYICVIDKKGNIGYGESSPSRAVVGSSLSSIIDGIELFLEHAIKQELTGLDLCKVRKIFETYVKSPKDALTGIEMAFLDLSCREIGLPLWRFFGSEKKDLITDITVSLGDPYNMIEEAKEYISRGFRILKVKLGEPERDLERIRILLDNIPSRIRVRIDANQGWRDLKTAIRFVKVLESYDNVEIIEQPLPRMMIDELRILRERTSLPIILDESVMSIRDISYVWCRGACDGINMKLMKFGSVIDGFQACRLARELGLKVMIGCMLETQVSITAAACIAAACDVDYVDLDSPLLIESIDVKVSGGVTYDQDRIILPSEPGLGVRLEI